MSVELLLPGDLQAARMADGRRRLLRDLNLRIEGELFSIPKGFLSDFSSMPWLSRLLVRWDRVDIAGEAHDYAYAFGTHGKGGRTLTRREADRIWRIVAMAGKHHANAVQGWLGWAGLRLGGWVTWGRYRAGRPSLGSRGADL